MTPPFNPNNLLTVAACALFSGGAIFSGPVLAASDPASQSSLDARGRIVAQKTKLIQSLLISKTVEMALLSGRQAAKDLHAEIERLLKASGAETKNGQYTQADAKLDAAMKKIAALAAIGNQAKAKTDPAAEKKRYHDLRTGIEGYINAVNDALTEKGTTKFTSATKAEISRYSESAENAARQGDYSRANEMLTVAYKLAVKLIFTLRDKDTIVYALKFDTPWDEYEYEKERNNSYGVLIDALLAEHNPPTAIRRLVQAYLVDSRKYYDAAQHLVSENKIETAVVEIERANRLLAQALRAISPKYSY